MPDQCVGLRRGDVEDVGDVGEGEEPRVGHGSSLPERAAPDGPSSPCGSRRRPGQTTWLSPRRPAGLARPKWRDTRLLLGVLLVMTSVVVGRGSSPAPIARELVWTVATDLADGIQLTSADLQPRAVRLGSVSGNYLRVAGGGPVGATLARAVSAGDLLPSAALAATSDGRLEQGPAGHGARGGFPLPARPGPRPAGRRLRDARGRCRRRSRVAPTAPQRLVAAALVGRGRGRRFVRVRWERRDDRRLLSVADEASLPSSPGCTGGPSISSGCRVLDVRPPTCRCSWPSPVASYEERLMAEIQRTPGPIRIVRRCVDLATCSPQPRSGGCGWPWSRSARRGSTSTRSRGSRRPGSASSGIVERS